MTSKWFLSKTWPRPLYILYRIFEMFVSLVSRGWNAVVLSGSTYQTTSARCHIENWPRGRAIVNTLFFWQEDHCKWAWDREVAEAKKTLSRAAGPKSFSTIVKEHDDA